MRARCEIVEGLGGSKYRVETTVTDGDRALEGEAAVLVDPLPEAADADGHED